MLARPIHKGIPKTVQHLLEIHEEHHMHEHQDDTFENKIETEIASIFITDSRQSSNQIRKVSKLFQQLNFASALHLLQNENCFKFIW